MEFIRKSRDKDSSPNKELNISKNLTYFDHQNQPPLHGTAEWIFLTNDDFHLRISNQKKISSLNVMSKSVH